MIMHSEKSLSGRTTSALAWSYSGAIAKALAQLLIQVSLARILGPTAFGQASLVLVFLGVSWLLADGGFGAALIQKAEIHDDDIAYALGWVLVLSIAFGMVLVLAAPYIATALDDTSLTSLLRAGGLLVPLQALSNIPVSLLLRELDMKRLQILQVGSYIIGMGGVGVALALAGLGAWSLIIGFAVQGIAVLLVGYAQMPHPIRLRFSGDSALRTFGLSVMATNIANWAIDNVDRLLVGRFWGQSALGSYAAMANLSRAPAGLLIGSVQSVVFASSSRSQVDKSRLVGGFLAASNLVLLITCPVFCFAALEAEFIVQGLYGNNWVDASPMFAAFCMSIPSYALLSVAGPMLWGLGTVRIELKIQLIFAGLIFFGFVLFSGLPLTTAVWLVPFVFLARALAIVFALAQQLDISLGQVMRAALGGLCLAVLTAASDMASSMLFDSGITRASACAIFVIVAGLPLVSMFSSWFVAPALQRILLDKAEASKPISRLCSVLRLRRFRQ